MSKKRMIDTDFWADTFIVDNLNPLDRYLFIYLFTNSHTTIAGVYQLSLRMMAFETGLETNQLTTMLRDLEPKVKYVDGWVILRNGIKNQQYRNSKIATGIKMALEHVPGEILQHIAWPKDFGNPKPEGSKQSKLFDDLSMTHTRPIHEPSHSNSNSNINPNPNFNSNAADAAGSEKIDKKAYAKAVKADEAQAERAAKATKRTGSTKSLKEMYEETRAKKEGRK